MSRKSEAEAREKLRRKDLSGIDHVAVVGKKGGGLEYNEGQSVSQGRGSGLKDVIAAAKAARARKK